MSIPQASTPGFLLVHGAAGVDRARLEGAIDELVRVVQPFVWSSVESLQLATASAARAPEPLYRASFEFLADLDTTAQLATRLAAFQTIWFEVALTFSSKGLGQRYCYTPTLGMFHSQLDEAGNQLFNENQIRIALQSATKSGLQAQMTKMLGAQWDAQLDQLRKFGIDGESVTNLAS
ncbi:MAG: hypothetical protein RL196_1054 [Actinomycetota bacterium]|jgi:hypothetical protein